MKNLLLAGAAVALAGCTSQNAASAPNESVLANSGQLVFNAERANPTNYDVLRVMSGIPNSTGMRVLDLGRGYTMTLSEKELKADLPYFGRVYNPSMDPDKAGIKFSTKNFSLKKSTTRKGAVVYQLSPNDVAVKTMYLEIYKNGKALLSVDSNDRQPITYDGSIAPLPSGN